MASKFKGNETLVSIPGSWISLSHTFAAYAAFVGAFVVGVSLHYKKIVQNEHYGFPDEWFPSVSATIGDRYPERSVFQLFIAVTSGPRFALVLLWYLLAPRPRTAMVKFVIGMGIFRTFTCGGWTYVTSTDDHDWHDIFMISYLIATLPWTLGCIAISPPNEKAIKYRKMIASTFFGTLVPLIYWFIQHKVHKRAGAYTIYSFFEWSLVLLDVAFDAVTMIDFSGLEIIVRDVKGVTRGDQKASSNFATIDKAGNDVQKARQERFSLIATIDVISDVYIGFIYWTLVTSLGVTIWYFPLWHMGISGYEAFVMSTISPFLFTIRSVRNFATQNIRTVHLMSLSGLFSYLVMTPEYRLFAVSLGVSMTCLAWAATFNAYRMQQPQLEAKIFAFGSGLILSSVAKFAFYTNNPIWPVVNAENGGWNRLGIFLSVISVLWSTRQPLPKLGVLESATKSGKSPLAALGVSGLLFGMHSLLSDSSTMILWVWEGYPIRGPMAVPHGYVTIFVMALGLYAGVIKRTPTLFTFKLTNTPKLIIYVTGAIGAYVLTNFSNWIGYAGGLYLAYYLMRVAPILLSSAAQHHPAQTFGLAFLGYNILVLAHVWVVAYAFVPGGPLMREHTDWVMAAMMICIGVGLFNSGELKLGNGKSRKQSSPIAARKWPYYLWSLVTVQLLAAGIAYMRFPAYNYTPYHPEENMITAGIWTIHFSLDNDMWSSERRIRELIKDAEIDVIGLLESDLQRIIMGNRDTTQFLAEDLGMYVDYGPGPNKHTWGAALLSKFPIVNSTHHLLPSPVGELAPAIHATIEAYGSLVDVFVFHSGQEEDAEDRRLQTEYLSELMGSSPRPSILLSYLVTKPKKGNYKTYVSPKSGMRDIDPSDWERWCEYILYKGLKRSGYARVSRSTITDTELQVGKFIVGQPEGSDDVIGEEAVPVGQRFPALLKGQGVRGHRYHVFDKPRYYA